MFSLRQSRQLLFLGALAAVSLIVMLIFISANNSRKGGTWICRGGIWSAQGRPSTDKPKTPCY